VTCARELFNTGHTENTEKKRREAKKKITLTAEGAQTEELKEITWNHERDVNHGNKLEKSVSTHRQNIKKQARATRIRAFPTPRKARKKEISEDRTPHPATILSTSKTDADGYLLRVEWQ